MWSPMWWPTVLHHLLWFPPPSPPPLISSPWWAASTVTTRNAQPCSLHLWPAHSELVSRHVIHDPMQMCHITNPPLSHCPSPHWIWGMWAFTLFAMSSCMYGHCGRHIRPINRRVGESTGGQVYQWEAGVSTGGRCIDKGQRYRQWVSVSTGGVSTKGGHIDWGQGVSDRKSVV